MTDSPQVLPTVHDASEFIEADDVMSWAPSFPDHTDRPARMFFRILDPAWSSNACVLSYSLLSNDTRSDFTSLSSSVKEHVYENGRRYHSLNAGTYVMPNDEVSF